MKVEELSVPQACTELLEDYRGFNNTVLEFWNSFKDRFAWSILPTQFLYDLYQSYCKRNAPSSRIMNLQDFRFDIKRIADESDDFEYGRFTVGTQMDAAEMLIIEYNLFHWMDPEYTGNIPEKILAFERKPQYTGVRRLTPKPQGTSE